MKRVFFILIILFFLLNCSTKQVVKENKTTNISQNNIDVVQNTITVSAVDISKETLKQNDYDNITPVPTHTQESITITAKVLIGPKQKDKQKDKIEIESQRFFPASIGNKWFYQGYWKNDKDKKIVKVKAEILNIEKRDGKEYFYYYAPKVGIRYLNRKDEKGVYMRVIKFPFPIFSFALIEVDIVPEMLVIKFPLKVGEKWTQKAKASTTLFGFWKIERDIQSDFEVVEKVKINTGVGEIEAYHIRANVDNSYEKTVENYWYGKDIGYSVSDTTSYFVKVHGYIIKDEKTGEIRKVIPPEGTKEYE
ncbi:MAG: hypothetical protein N2114_00145 [Candidatus Goldbacteria bacterium]|nr:hypothetical protein [Candidatus Goldiibacteriota bacterium]